MTRAFPSAAVLGTLWKRPDDDAFAELLPTTWEQAFALSERLRAHVDAAPRRLEGTVDSAAIVRGEIVSMGPGSVIEAGAIVHESCRLVLGQGSRLRSTSLVRDDVVIGPGCLVGAYCELARAILGAGTALGHWVFVADSILGADSMLGGAAFLANSALTKGRTIRVSTPEMRFDSKCLHLGVLSGDGVRFGVQALASPGTIIAPGLEVPPRVVLNGYVDAARIKVLRRRFMNEWIVARPGTSDPGALDR